MMNNAYHSWEKGSVENINGLIVSFLPKGDNIIDDKLKKLKTGLIIEV